MHLEINDNTSFKEIQDTFSNYYPFLKIEFFRHAHKKYEASSETDRIDPAVHVGEIKLTHVSGVLEIQPLYRTADVENEFMNRFGISVQILRRLDSNWEQTTGMDDFTLKQLNDLGRNASDEFIISDYEQGFIDQEEKPEKLL